MSQLDIKQRLMLLASGDNLELVDIVHADAIARIVTLEAALAAKSVADWSMQNRCIEDLQAQIRAMEAALREIASQPHMVGNAKSRAIARAALEQDKP